ncbi:hypothetical protein B0H17DRAFT_1135608 [Mycena rosella]|uniref:Uncharacterized protein n=1 Tax=Mycena rosella TaxID=1033263 RepID=A0AAD7DCY2_MYCRO|nr:hypothetical protein B0H17DRAFT_1135608 [Mycena rosella]
MPKGVLKGVKINNTFGLENQLVSPLVYQIWELIRQIQLPLKWRLKNRELRHKKDLNGIQGTSGTNEYVASEHDDKEGVHKIWLSDFEELNKLAQPTMYRVGGDEIPSVDMESTW